MDLKARLCIELDNSVTAELLVTSYYGSGPMVVWSQNFATLLTISPEHDMSCARAALEEQVKKANDLLGEAPRIKVYKVVKEYEEIYEKPAKIKPIAHAVEVGSEPVVTPLT